VSGEKNQRKKGTFPVVTPSESVAHSLKPDALGPRPRGGKGGNSSAKGPEQRERLFLGDAWQVKLVLTAKPVKGTIKQKGGDSRKIALISIFNQG